MVEDVALASLLKKDHKMISRRTFLKASGGVLVSGNRAFAGMDCAESGLGDIACEKGIRYGAAVRAGRLKSIPAYRSAILENCNVVVSESEMKWRHIEPRPEHYNFEQADQIVDFATSNGLEVRGHELIRSRSAPDWLPEQVYRLGSINAHRIMERYIFTVMRRYRGTITDWDVINEALSPNVGLLSDRKNFWYHAMGPAYIDAAFHLAHEADPDAKLVCNDNLMEYDLPEDEVKRRAFIDLLSGFRKRGVPCHVAGLQSHLTAGKPFNAEIYSAFLKEISDMGYEIYITELDVQDNLAEKSIEQQDQCVASAAEAYLDVALAQPNVKKVLTWGITDRLSSQTSFYWSPIEQGREPEDRGEHLPRPLPLDSDFARKPIWYAIARAFKNAPVR